MGGPIERIGGLRLVADVPAEGDIAGRLGPNRRCAGRRRPGGIDDRRERFVVDDDQLGGVLRRGQRRGDDNGDGLADVAHPTAGEQRARRQHHQTAVAIVDRCETGQTAETGRLDVRADIDGKHAGRGGGRVGIDHHKLCMGVGRAQKIRVDLTRQVDVVGVLALAGEQSRVLLAPHRLTDSEFSHRHLDQASRGLEERRPVPTRKVHDREPDAQPPNSRTASAGSRCASVSPRWASFAARGALYTRRANVRTSVGHEVGMRAEIETFADEIKQSLELLRRHL